METSYSERFRLNEHKYHLMGLCFVWSSERLSDEHRAFELTRSVLPSLPHLFHPIIPSLRILHTRHLRLGNLQNPLRLARRGFCLWNVKAWWRSAVWKKNQRKKTTKLASCLTKEPPRPRCDVNAGWYKRTPGDNSRQRAEQLGCSIRSCCTNWKWRVVFVRRQKGYETPNTPVAQISFC